MHATSQIMTPYPYTHGLQLLHPSQCVASDPLLGLFAAAFTLIFTYDNFKVALDDAYKAFQERATGRAQVVICVVYVFMKFYESLEDLPVVRRLKSLTRLPTWPANNRIHRDTAVIVIISYVLLLDINLSYIWLAIFPAIAIAFIYALRIEFCPPGEAGELADSSNNGDQDKTTQGPQKALKALAAVPFGLLLVMAQLDDGTTDWFTISQFLLFLSTTLGALTYMMMRLPPGISPGIAPASELLHKAFLLLLLVTLHTLAAEALGEDVVLFCMLELLPVILWFSLHLDRDSSIISADKVTKLRRNMLIVSGGVVMVGIGPIVAYLAFATSIDVFGLPWCTVTMKSAGVSGLLTYYMVFMLRQWPGRQRGKVDDVAAADISSLHSSKTKGGKRKGATGSEEASQSEEQDAGMVIDDLAAVNTSSLLQLSKKRRGKGKGATGSSEEASGKAVDNVAAANASSLQSTKKKSGKGEGKGATGSSEGGAKSKEQASAGSSEEAVHVQLLELWAIFLLIPAAASLLLLLKIMVAPT